MVYHLYLHETVQLADDNNITVAVPTKGLACLAYLLVKNKPVSRQELAALLWPNSTVETAYTNLRSTLSRMHGALRGSPPLILADATHISLVETSLKSDLGIFEVQKIDHVSISLMLKMVRHPFLKALCRELPFSLGPFIAEVQQHHEHLLRIALVSFSKCAKSEEEQILVRDAALILLERYPADEFLRGLLGPRVRLSSPTASRIEVEMQGKNAHPKERPPRLALLPPNADGSGERYEIAVGLIEDVTVALCCEREIAVVAPYTAEQIRREADKVEALQRHNVSYVMDCHVSLRGLFAQLIFLPTDEVIWANRFELRGSSLVEVRNEIAFNVLEAIKARIWATGPRHADFEAHPEAYQDYLVGLQGMGGLQLASIRRARKFFRQALNRHAGLAVANSAMSRTHALEWLLTARGDHQLLDKAVEFAEIAIQLDPLGADGHRELGVARLYLGDLDASIAALHHAEQLSPHHADGLYSYGDTLVHAARPADALAKLETALSLNPLAPDAYHWSAAGACYFLERYEDALAHVENMKDKTAADRIAAASHAMLGNKGKAQYLRRRSMGNNPTFDVDAWTAMIPFKEAWQTALYRDGLKKAGF
ncbi:hypothetical protein GAO09_10630 [Rhizobiales bacterium RZME27]|uniref:Uncharacterized protein n=1 Tax=Endobacterium cereale TaxID=2663029 RepID=A0A6A8AA40_9HYPH|nr:hypothetical protein [Endobacterium cereale]MEB2846781.1 hypothetical protein [Endobacterium cereale]MQY46500.1 hypothetical protein [Endobacterium cereale]